MFFSHLLSQIVRIVYMELIFQGNIGLSFLVLLLYPSARFQKLLSRFHYNSLALKTFMDAYQGNYKDGTSILTIQETITIARGYSFLVEMYLDLKPFLSL